MVWKTQEGKTKLVCYRRALVSGVFGRFPRKRYWRVNIALWGFAVFQSQYQDWSLVSLKFLRGSDSANPFHFRDIGRDLSLATWLVRSWFSSFTPSHRDSGAVKWSTGVDTVFQRTMLKLSAFSLTFRCWNVSALPKGFGVQEMKIQQSGLLFEQSRSAVQARRADGPGRLAPCGAGKVSALFHLPWSNFCTDHGVARRGPPAQGGSFWPESSVAKADHTESGSCSARHQATYFSCLSLRLFIFR